MHIVLHVCSVLTKSTLLHKPLEVAEALPQVTTFWQDQGYVWHANTEKHAFALRNAQGEKVGQLNLPILLDPLVESISPTAYWAKKPEMATHYWLVLMQAGEAALGRVVHHQLVEQKRIRKYMVRKKQGKSQLKHLNQKGKSRAGSRIRLKQTARFFEDINSLLHQWKEVEEPQKILYSCTATLWPHWFAQAPFPPYAQNHALWQRINWYINNPDGKALKKSLYHAQYATILFHDEAELAMYQQQFNQG